MDHLRSIFNLFEVMKNIYIIRNFKLSIFMLFENPSTLLKNDPPTPPKASWTNPKNPIKTRQVVF